MVSSGSLSLILKAVFMREETISMTIKKNESPAISIKKVEAYKKCSKMQIYLLESVNPS